MIYSCVLGGLGDAPPTSNLHYGAPYALLASSFVPGSPSAFGRGILPQFSLHLSWCSVKIISAISENDCCIWWIEKQEHLQECPCYTCYSVGSFVLDYILNIGDIQPVQELQEEIPIGDCITSFPLLICSDGCANSIGHLLLCIAQSITAIT